MRDIDGKVKFPSLSESSGFPTFESVIGHLKRKLKFPSLSESSGFPTLWGNVSNAISALAGFHLFQRVVGFRPPHEINIFTDGGNVSISFRE